MAELARQDVPVSRKVMPRDEAVDFFQGMGEDYKAEIISDIPPGEDISLYRRGRVHRPVSRPARARTGKLKAFKLMKVAGAYWRGDSDNEMLQRIYGTAWANKEELKAYLHRLEEAEKRDHRKLGSELDCSTSRTRRRAWCSGIPRAGRCGSRSSSTCAVSTGERLPGSRPGNSGPVAVGENPATGTTTARTCSPPESEKRDYALKPMNCPGHIQIFKPGCELPRFAAALRRVWLVPSQRALGRAARHHAGARLHAGRWSHLLYRRPDPARSAAFTARCCGLPGFRLHRRYVQDRHAARQARRQRRAGTRPSRP